MILSEGKNIIKEWITLFIQILEYLNFILFSIQSKFLIDYWIVSDNLISSMIYKDFVTDCCCFLKMSYFIFQLQIRKSDKGLKLNRKELYELEEN